MDRLETIDRIKAIEFRIKETKQAINCLKNKIGNSKVTIEFIHDSGYNSTKETIFSNTIFNGIMLEALESQLTSDKRDLKSLVLETYSEVFE